MGSTEKTFDLDSWKMPEEFIQDGIIYSERFNYSASLDAIKHWTSEEGDVIVASYPKAGKIITGL